ncbi:MAG: type IV toxin-antitoxin system AbiEi family antitoxin domain-containing protein [Myxococcaceae bacterium]|nr:type IV toxin-antitoxin system AbiEi family antitoxin domain-containing protein [Myxococcaceae bacterium]
MRDFTEVSELAAKQGGVVSRAQLFERGYTRHSIQYGTDEGLLTRHQYRGVYRLASTAVDDDTHPWAALLWAGDGAVLSHLTAGWLWKLEGLGKKRPDVVHVSVPNATQHVAKKTVRLWRVRTLVPVKDFALLGGFPCTSLSRTLIDLAGVLDKKALEHAFDSAMRRSPDNLEALFDALRRLTNGRSRMGALIEVATRQELGPTHSWLENETRQAMRAAKIPTPLPQYEVRDEQKRFICRPDFAWPEVSVALFCDSWEHHGSQRKRFELDPVQRNKLQVAGWRPVVVTDQRLLTDRAGFIEELRAILGRR